MGEGLLQAWPSLACYDAELPADSLEVVPSTDTGDTILFTCGTYLLCADSEDGLQRRVGGVRLLRYQASSKEM